MTRIEWTDTVWNPTTGCDRVSPGCDHCYALTMAKRLKGMGSAKYQNDGDPKTSGPGFGITMHEDVLQLPTTWRKPRKIFVNSMSDLFHAGVTDRFIARVFAVMAATPQHTYQILTKRHARMRSLLGDDGLPLMEALNVYPDDEAAALTICNTWWPLRNVWMGVSAENQAWADIRIPALLETPAAVRWVSAEPLLGSIDFLGPQDQWGNRPELTYWLRGQGRPYFPDPEPGELLSGPLAFAPTLDWVVVGGESGPGSRAMDTNWARTIRDQCAATGTPFFFKQYGDRVAGRRVVGKAKASRLLDGRTHDQYPMEASA